MDFATTELLPPLLSVTASPRITEEDDGRRRAVERDRHVATDTARTLVAAEKEKILSVPQTRERWSHGRKVDIREGASRAFARRNIRRRLSQKLSEADEVRDWCPQAA